LQITEKKTTKKKTTKKPKKQTPRIPAAEAAPTCPTCLCVRTARSSHCRICDRCVPRLDHHCVWLGKCVGAGNHGRFLLAAATAAVACGTCAGACAHAAALALGSAKSAGVAATAIICGITVLPVLAAVCYLLYYHWWLLSEGFTTREWVKMIQPGGSPDGCCANLAIVACAGPQLAPIEVEAAAEAEAFLYNDGPPDGWDDAPPQEVA
jgi:hypothetical protein